MNQQLKYTVDITLCIDATGSMGPVISDVKENALKFYKDLSDNMTNKGKAINELQIRVIAFRDYYVDGAKSMDPSGFFKLPAQSADFATFVSGIFADGGGDEPENGLEAVALAIKSDWNKNGDKRRQIIVIWTDASAHPLEKRKTTPLSANCSYPSNIPASLDELTDLWEGQEFMNASGKRLIIYSPDSYPWTDIANNWNNSIHFASQAGHGLSDIEYNAIIDAIANSI
jgi:hypothetical protein